MSITQWGRCVLASGALGIGALGATAVQAADYSGTTIEWIVPSSAGGGTDLWSRTFAPLFAERLPGEPTITVRNVPGGASLIGANEFEQIAEPNGETALVGPGSMTIGYLFRDQRIRFNMNEWIPIIASPQGTVIYGNPDLGIEGPEDLPELEGQRLVYGSREPTGSDLPMLLGFELLGLNLNPIFGMGGRSDGRLGYERGEFNIDRQTTSAYQDHVVPMVENGEAVPLFSFGVLGPDGNLQRDPNFPDLPHFGEAYEMIHGEAPSGPAWDAWKAFMAAGYGVSKALYLPAGTSDDVVADYVEAAQAILADDEARAQVEEVIGTYDMGTGDNAALLVDQALTISDEADAWIRDWLTENYDVQF